MILRSVAAFTLSAGCSLAFSALAQPIEPGKEGQIARLLPPEPGTRICFARQYDGAHLKAHPDQQVQSIGFSLAYHAHDPDEYYPKGQRNYYFELRAKMRSGQELAAGGECVPAEDGKNIHCGVECDGGAVLIRQAAKKGQLLVDLEATGRIRMSDGCDDESGIDLEPGIDDKTFLLSEIPADRCPAYEDW
ncbi:hypothetical protein MesoLjLb_70190 [Mesorhizobium sp. L-8-3]|nr:hypothetical protein MesoLjLb_70190 [Mesorhizobium sp. L-8-3]